MPCRRQLHSIFASGATLQLQYPAEDLGFTYPTPATAVNTARSAQRDEPSHTAEGRVSAPGHTLDGRSLDSIDTALERIKARRAAHAERPATEAPAAGGAAAAGAFEPRLQAGGRLPHFELLLHGSCSGDAAAAAAEQCAMRAGRCVRSGAGGAAAPAAAAVTVSSIDLASMSRGRRLCVVCAPEDPISSQASGGPSCGSTAARDWLFANGQDEVDVGDVLVVVVWTGGSSGAGAAGDGVGGARMEVDGAAVYAFAVRHGRDAVWLGRDVQGQLEVLTGGRRVGVWVRPDGHIERVCWQGGGLG